MSGLGRRRDPQILSIGGQGKGPLW